ncbi:cytochrome B pre-mRNA-processing protein 6 [Podospora fimiseda]|uniref:Cytochrome B pre-mRNA-processing protein 6 n=1 Tax=Podospora fimiseda TaxID=252190 RepID=A0AAN7BLW0_9PEZI|nr:cytochrome B pre-mRNA-processing protein 6 [Podospora fimiseda]
MSAIKSSSAARLFQGALQRWPKDPLRPECQLQDVLAKRLAKGNLAPPSTIKGASKTQAELKQANALYSLLENRYNTKYRAGPGVLEPKSNPTYYKDLVQELEEAPNRTFLQRLAKRLTGMIRLT